MPQIRYCGRRAAFIENDDLRVTVLAEGGQIAEILESLCAFDRPIGWTQHVTLGPRFLERGVTQFRSSACRHRPVRFLNAFYSV